MVKNNCNEAYIYIVVIITVHLNRSRKNLRSLVRSEASILSISVVITKERLC